MGSKGVQRGLGVAVVMVLVVTDKFTEYRLVWSNLFNSCNLYNIVIEVLLLTHFRDDESKHREVK